MSEPTKFLLREEQIPTHWVNLLPDLSYPTTMVERIGLFNDPEKERFARMTHWIFLGLFVALITAEWIVRKASGLV